MGIIRKIAIVVLTISFITFIALFGQLPELRNTPIGLLNRLLCIRIPRILCRVDERLTGGRITALSSRCGQYLLHEKHPLVLIFFLGLLTSASLAFLLRIWSRLSHPHHLAIFVLLPLPYLFTYLCVISTASEIKASNHFQEIQRYPFDYTLYHPGKVCSTCGLEKPARSKHCSTCKCCVAKADHHCAWVNSCIGRDNYRWFLALMLSLGIVLSYGAWLARGQMAPLVPTDHLWQGRHGLKGRIERWSSAIAKDVHIGAVGLLALLTAPLAWGLLAYHAYLIWAGMTTNETSKWSALREQMADGLFWKAKRSEVFSQRRGRPIQREGKKDRAFCVSWPIKTDQILLKESEVNLPDFPGLKADANGHSTWEKCWQLGQVENLYDLGFWDNFRDALCLEI